MNGRYSCKQPRTLLPCTPTCKSLTTRAGPTVRHSCWPRDHGVFICHGALSNVEQYWSKAAIVYYNGIPMFDVTGSYKSDRNVGQHNDYSADNEYDAIVANYDIKQWGNQPNSRQGYLTGEEWNIRTKAGLLPPSPLRSCNILPSNTSQAQPIRLHGFPGTTCLRGRYLLATWRSPHLSLRIIKLGCDVAYLVNGAGWDLWCAIQGRQVQKAWSGTMSVIMGFWRLLVGSGRRGKVTNGCITDALRLVGSDRWSRNMFIGLVQTVNSFFFWSSYLYTPMLTFTHLSSMVLKPKWRDIFLTTMAIVYGQCVPSLNQQAKVGLCTENDWFLHTRVSY